MLAPDPGPAKYDPPAPALLANGVCKNGYAAGDAGPDGGKPGPAKVPCSPKLPILGDVKLGGDPVFGPCMSRGRWSAPYWSELRRESVEAWLPGC